MLIQQELRKYYELLRVTAGGRGGRVGGWPRALTAGLHLSLVQDLQAGAPAQAAGEKDPRAVEMGHSDGEFLPSIRQTLPLSGLKLRSQFPQNLGLGVQVAAVRADGAGSCDGIPQVDNGGWEADAPALLQAWGRRGWALSHSYARQS